MVVVMWGVLGVLYRGFSRRVEWRVPTTQTTVNRFPFGSESPWQVACFTVSNADDELVDGRMVIFVVDVHVLSTRCCRTLHYAHEIALAWWYAIDPRFLVEGGRSGRVTSGCLRCSMFPLWRYHYAW